MPCEHHPCSLGDELEEWHAGFGGGRRHVGPSSLPTACGLWKQNHRSQCHRMSQNASMQHYVPGSRSLAARFRKRPASWAAVEPPSNLDADLPSLVTDPACVAWRRSLRNWDCTPWSAIRIVSLIALIIRLLGRCRKRNFCIFCLQRFGESDTCHYGWHQTFCVHAAYLRNPTTVSGFCLEGIWLHFPEKKTVNNRILYCHATWRHGDGVAWCLSHRRSFGGSSGHFSADP
jgi:hypothetical protein